MIFIQILLFLLAGMEPSSSLASDEYLKNEIVQNYYKTIESVLLSETNFSHEIINEIMTFHSPFGPDIKESANGYIFGRVYGSNAEFGETWEDPDGSIWTDFIKTSNGEIWETSPWRANFYCRSHGARVPTRKDIERLFHFLGNARNIENKDLILPHYKYDHTLTLFHTGWVSYANEAKWKSWIPFVSEQRFFYNTQASFDNCSPPGRTWAVGSGPHAVICVK